jgi:hypothetical protein
MAGSRRWEEEFHLYPPFIKYVGRSSPAIARIFWRMLKNYVSTGALDIA